MARRWLKILMAASAVALVASQPVAAQEALKVKAGKAWKHKHSGISVPATLAGTSRATATGFAPDELDVGLSFVIGDAVESLSVYVFRNTNGAVPVWFSQAQWAIENRDVYGRPKAIQTPQAFTPPGQTSASGLKVIYELDSSSYRSTGVMMLPVGKWYVKIRASSQTRSPTELGEWMDMALAEISFPAIHASDAAAAAIPVTACPSPLSFPVEAKDAPKNGGADLLAGLMGTAVGKGDIKPTPESTAALATVRWCRDTELGGNASVYRRDADPERYLVAMGDNGNGISVGPDAMAALLDQTDAGKESPQRFSIILISAAQNVTFVAQDRLPSPQRVAQIVNENRRVTTTSTWGKDTKVSINADAL